MFIQLKHLLGSNQDYNQGGSKRGVYVAPGAQCISCFIYNIIGVYSGLQTGGGLKEGVHDTVQYTVQYTVLFSNQSLLGFKYKVHKYMYKGTTDSQSVAQTLSI